MILHPKSSFRIPRILAFGLIVAASVSVFAQQAPTNSTRASNAQDTSLSVSKQEPVKLDVFTVNTNRDVGFVATESLAGGRLAGALAETPVAYSVQTREFLDALNISDMNEAINWTVSATTTPDDGGGQLFGGTGTSTIRGVSSNQSSRNFFAGGSNPSTYNMERLDYARGPNSILFGTGTISGTANAVVKTANLGRNATEFRAEYGSWDSYRASLDANYALRKNLAGRLVATWQDTNSWRDWEHTQRRGVSPSVTFEPTRKTRLSVVGDYYEQVGTAGMNSLTDSFSGWDGRTVYSGIQPTTLPSQAAFGTTRIGSNTWVVSPASGRGYDTALSYTGMMQTTSFSGQRAINGVATANASNLGFAGPILDEPATTPGLYDAATQGSAFRVPSRSFTNLGPNPTSINRFRDATFFLDHQFSDSFGVQLSGDANRLYKYGLIDYYTNQNYPLTYVDVNRLLPDGASNPNFLQPYNEFIRPERTKVETTNKAVRLAAAYMKSTRWFDLKANVLGAIEKQSIFTAREYYMVPADPDPRAWGLITSTRTQTLRYRYYWNQPQREIVDMKEITLIDPATGTSRTLRPQWVVASDRNDATNFSDATTKYYQAAANLSFWKKRLIFLGAYRLDSVDRSLEFMLRPLDHPANFGAITRDHFLYRPNAPADYFNFTYVPKDAAGNPTGPRQLAPATRPRDASTGLALPQYASDRFQDDFNPLPTSTKKPTKSLGGIFNLGRGFSLWANYAQTFNPTDFTKTTIDFGTPPPSVAEGKDYGIHFSLGPRFYATLSRYESKEQNASISLPTGSTAIQTIIDTNVLGDLSSDGRNRRNLGDMPISWNDTLGRGTRGYELEVVANLTPNWRLTVNYGLANATQTNAYAKTGAWVDSHDAVLRQILDDAGVQIDASGVASVKSGVSNINSPDATSAANAWNLLRSSRANWVSGTQYLNRFTKYTANFYSDYRLTEGKLRGLRLGYGMQFRGPQVIGYRGSDTIVSPTNPNLAIDDPKVDAYTPVWQKAYYLATATVGYPIKFGHRQKVDLNLSVTNLFNYDKPIYNNTGLRASDGNLTTVARTTYPRAYSYTMPRSFRLSATYQF
jgi:outer membrane receptor protein involved in Fe transport